jgi:hypothetical protein
MGHWQVEQVAAMKRGELEQAAARWQRSRPVAGAARPRDRRAQRNARNWRWRVGAALALAGARLAGVDGRAVTEGWRRAC